MQNVFKRYEKKYLITEAQYESLIGDINQSISPDDFGEYTVQNLYFDTDNWDIIRTSIEKPLYKEKMRLRCYDASERKQKLFLELKKKYRGIVYKRRVAIPEKQLHTDIIDVVKQDATQISQELSFHLLHNPVCEKMYLSHKRVAFKGVEEKGLRITFDRDIRYRVQALGFVKPDKGKVILPPDIIVMEIKVTGGMPLWLTNALSKNRVFPRSFSKYGTCYADYNGVGGRLTMLLKKGKVEITSCLT